MNLDAVQMVFRVFGSPGANLVRYEMSGENDFFLVHIRCELQLSMLCRELAPYSKLESYPRWRCRSNLFADGQDYVTCCTGLNFNLGENKILTANNQLVLMNVSKGKVFWITAQTH
jgi:hypothetical protein